MIELHDLAAKSDQMNAIDLTQATVFKVSKVDYAPRQPQPISIHLEGYEGRPYKPCKGMLRGLAKAWGMDEQKWIGSLIEIYCDPSVKWAGKEAGGIRISGVSGISSPLSFTVRVNRSQSLIHKFKVLNGDQEAKKQFIETHYQADIEDAKTNEAISAIVKDVQDQFGAEALEKIKDSVIEARAKFKTEQA